MDDTTDEVFADAREEGEDDHVVVEAEVGRHRLLPVRLQDALAVIGDVHACIDEVREIERLESVELLGTLFRGAVAAQQMASEVDTHFWHQGMALFVLRRSNLDGGDEVLLAVGT